MTDTAEHDGETAEAGRSVTDPTDLKFVGSATAEVVAEASFDAEDIAARRVSYRMLVEAGVNPGVAAKIRRWHSLSWSFDSGSGLDRRSEQVRGLQDDERAWVAASAGDWAESSDAASDPDPGREEEWTPGDGPRATSSTGATTTDDWTPGGWGDAGASPDDDATADGSGDAAAAESAWRERSVPTPVTVIDGLVADDAEQLAEAGVTSVRSLATCTPELVADILGFEQARVETWQGRARDRME